MVKILFFFFAVSGRDLGPRSDANRIKQGSDLLGLVVAAAMRRGRSEMENRRRLEQRRRSGGFVDRSLSKSLGARARPVGASGSSDEAGRSLWEHWAVTAATESIGDGGFDLERWRAGDGGSEADREETTSIGKMTPSAWARPEAWPELGFFLLAICSERADNV